MRFSSNASASGCVAFFFTTPRKRKRRVEARRAHLLTRAHGGRVPGRHPTHEATATMSQMVRLVARARGPPPLRPSREQRVVARLGSVRLPSERSASRPPIPHPLPADPPRLPAYFSPLRTHRRRSCRSGRPTWRRPTPRRSVPRVSRDSWHSDRPRERRTPTVAFVPDPTPPSAVGRRQRLAPPRLRPARQRRRRRQGEPRDRGAPERHRQGTRRHGSRQTRSFFFAPSRSRTAAESSTSFSRTFSRSADAALAYFLFDATERRPPDLQED